MRILALDVGSKNIGLALSDPFGMTAQPLTTVRRHGDDAADQESVLAVIDEYEVERIVVGYPRNMNGTVGPSCAMAEEFAEKIAAARPLPLVYWDERLTSRMAENAMLAADVSRKKRRQQVDALAAVLILQNYLDYLRNQKNNHQK